MSTLGPFLAGALFATGLGLSGMTQPAKVTAFLDFAGNWDPSLAFVMAGAIGVYAVLYRVIIRRPTSLDGAQFALPSQIRIDARLVVGAAIFGAGWGLAGFCPGPAITSLAGGMPAAVVFVPAMLVGMIVYGRLVATRPPAP